MSTDSSRCRVPRSGNEERIHGVLKSASRSMSAFETLDALEGTIIKAAVQVHRALDRLIAQRKVHWIESLNALVVCRCEAHNSPAGFFICEACGVTVEFGPAHGLGMMQTAVTGFLIHQANIELRGLRPACVPQEAQAS